MKAQILQQLIDRIKHELSGLEEAAEASRGFATDSEFKAESKYDTRSLEASYLASAEAKRVEELKQDLQILEEVELEASLNSEVISIGSLVELEFKQRSMWYFLVPVSGGEVLKLGDRPVMVVSVFSPIGDAMLGLRSGEEFEVETPKETRVYKVLSFN